jgi:hypothetical protein
VSLLCRGMYTAVASRTTLSAHLTDAQRGSLSRQDFTVVLVGSWLRTRSAEYRRRPGASLAVTVPD